MSTEKDQPHWLPYGYIGAGILGCAVVTFAILLGRANIIDAIIIGIAIGAIVVGVKQLLARRKSL
jgi:hypothetical protein